MKKTKTKQQMEKNTGLTSAIRLPILFSFLFYFIFFSLVAILLFDLFIRVDCFAALLCALFHFGFGFNLLIFIIVLHIHLNI